jgi:methylmalonyl-CoA mutase C-terminal domain/subunit
MATLSRKIRVVAAMPGLDCHDKGLIFLAHELRRAGMEVIYLGLFNTPEQIVKTAIEENADVIALSYLNDHLYMVFFPRVVELLKENNASDICVVAGGRITEEDKPKLEALGITGLFGQETPMEVIVDHIVQRVKKERWKEMGSHNL